MCGDELIQCKVIAESDQKTTLLNGISMVLDTCLNNFANNCAAHNSRRGRVVVLTGATRDFAQNSSHFITPFLSSDLK